MKKILAILLAVALVLSLSVTAFAADKSPESSPEIGNPSSPVGGDSAATGKYVYTVTTADGTPVTATLEAVTSGEIYDELKGAGVVAMYYVNLVNVTPDTIVNLNVYAPGVNADCAVVVRDAWEVLPEVTCTPNGNRATITGPANVFNTWHYVAIVSNANADVIVNVPQENTEQEEETEEVGAETPEVNVEEEDNTPAPAPSGDDANPGTGIALAVVPMIVAAAAVVVSKKR